MKRSLFLSLCILIGLSQTAFPRVVRLTPGVFRGDSGSFDAEHIHPGMFARESYINAGKNDIIWLETEIPQTGDDSLTIQFNSETFHKAEVYQLQPNGRWFKIGVTGSYYTLKEKNIPTWQQAVMLPDPVPGEKEEKIRIRIEPFKYQTLSVRLMSGKDHFRRATAQTFRLSIIIGLFLGVTAVIVFGGIFFKESFYLYIGGVILCMLGHFLDVSGMGCAYLWPFLANSNKEGSIIFVFSFGALFCGTGAILFDNKRILPVKHPEIVINIIFFFCMAITILQYLVFSKNSLQLLLTGIIIAILPVFLYICIKTSFFQSNSDKSMYVAWIVSLCLIILRQTFHILRGSFDSVIFRIFDNDLDWPMCLAALLITVPTLKNIVVRIRAKIAQLEIATATATERTMTADSRSFAYSCLASSLKDPASVIVSAASPSAGSIPPPAAAVTRSGRSMMVLLDTISSLSRYESGVAKVDENAEPVSLVSLLRSSVADQISDIKNRGNLPEIKRGFAPETCVMADRKLLSEFFQFIVDPTGKHATPGTPFVITTEYKNSLLSFSVHFSAAPLTETDAGNLLHLNYLSETAITPEEKENGAKLISDWGIGLHIAQRIVSLYNGSMYISPDPTGNTVVAQIVLAPAQMQTLSERAVKDEELLLDQDNNSQAQELSPLSLHRQHALFGESVLIIESDDAMRKSLSTLFSPFYKTVVCTNGQEAFTLLQNFVPDLILTSGELPVLGGEELLDHCSRNPRLSSVPFFFITNTSDKKRRLSLFRSGAVAVIENPFLPEELLAGVNAFLDNRRTVKSVVLSDITNAVRQGMVIAPQEPRTVPEPAAVPKQSGTVFDMAGKPVGEKEKTEKMQTPTSSQMALFTAANLSDREIEIAMLIAKGLSDKDIAARLSISPATVAVHNKKIFKKMDIHSRLELISRTL
jgi:DNA-binding NarL/FixJ family response regulator